MTDRSGIRLVIFVFLFAAAGNFHDTLHLLMDSDDVTHPWIVL